MHLAVVVGTVVATTKVPGLVGHRFLVLAPVRAGGEADGDPLVAVDLVSAAPGQRVLFVRAREAANALEDPQNPVDAAILGIVDAVRRDEG
jgi:ethanolamine utilization protein EutN